MNIFSDDVKHYGNRDRIDARVLKREARVRQVLEWAIEHNIEDVKILTNITKLWFSIQHEAAANIAQEVILKMSDGALEGANR